METTALSFVKNGEDRYEATFVSEGDCVIELERKEQRIVVVYAALDGMKYVPIANFHNPDVTDVIFRLRVPEEVLVKIKSGSVVSSGKMYVE